MYIAGAEEYMRQNPEAAGAPTAAIISINDRKRGPGRDDRRRISQHQHSHHITSRAVAVHLIRASEFEANVMRWLGSPVDWSCDALAQRTPLHA